uniref:Integrase catalytic domain-containing protein n=1 Tax=Sparus aurata TaxID=8175 RepID=A0A671V8A1_SPAAU
MIHQHLVRPGALLEASWVMVRCVHGDIHDYPVVALEMYFKVKKHRVRAGVSTRLTHVGGRGVGCLGCASCRECQLVNPPATPKVLLRPLPLIEVPIDRIAMDLIRPLDRSARGYRFVLVLVDYATRYPEAVPLSNISAKSVTQALFQVISQVGIPKEILTDQGTSFMSRSLRELYELLGVCSIRTSVYHPQTDGLVERFNKTLKNMIHKFMHKDSRNWVKWFDPLLFAVREAPQASAGFSPFELLFGRKPRGVLDLVRENWETGPSTSKNEVQHVLDLRAKLHSLGQLSLLFFNGGYTTEGQNLDSFHQEIKCSWDVNYEVVRSDRVGATQIYHINLLKAWR